MARASGRSSAPTRAGTTSSTALPGKGRSAARRRRRSGSWKRSPSTSTCSRRRCGRNLFPLGHVGIGTHLVPRSVRERMPWRWLALGCLLPDVIDKPVFLVAQWLGAESPLWDTARMVGHTAFLLAALFVWSRVRRTPQLIALVYGIPTHLGLEILTVTGMG